MNCVSGTAETLSERVTRGDLFQEHRLTPPGRDAAVGVAALAYWIALHLPQRLGLAADTKRAAPDETP